MCISCSGYKKEARRINQKRKQKKMVQRGNGEGKLNRSYRALEPIGRILTLLSE